MRRLILKLVLFSVVLMITATVNVHAEDWKGVDITNLSMTGDGYFESPISENALSDLKSRGVSVSGVGFTLVSVDLIKSDGTLRQNVFSGTYVANSWSSKSSDIDKSKFSNAEVGDYLRCTFTDKVTSGNNSYNPKFYKGNSWEDFPELQNRIYKDGVSSSEVYLYNVDTGKFLYIGGYWGVHAELLYRDFGLKFKVEKKTIEGKERYLFSSDVSTESSSTKGNNLGLMKGYQGDDQKYNDGIVVDMKPAVLASKDNSKPMYSYCYFNVVPVSGGTDGTYTYTLSLKPKELSKDSYAVAAGSKDQWDYMGTETYYLAYDGLKVVESTNSAGLWRFVPVSEIDAAVRNAALDVDAFNGMNLDITYKIDNQGFNRNNENHWTEEGATYVKYVKKNVNQSLYNLYTLDNQKENGKYYYGLMSSASDGGFISRGFYAPATGWYKVQCQGVSKSGNAYAFAKANGNDPVYAPLNKAENVLSYNEIVTDAHKQDRVDLGVDFYDNKYPVEVYFHATEGDYIMIGIQQMVGYTNDLTAFDDFQIKFLGEVFVLDEDYEECTDDNEYTEAHVGKTVILHRTFSKKEDGSYYWNTLTLPIDMTGAQVKSAFGDGVKLAEATGLDDENPYCITFQTVDANDGITAGHFYLIQPAKEPATPAGKTINIINKEMTGPLYTLGRRNVSKISELQTEFEDGGWNHPTHNSIRYHGTYLKKDGGVPGGSYVFSKGNMYHIKNAQNVKGFRFWIEDEEPNPNGQAKPFTLSISGVEDQQESQQIITSISEVETVTDDNAAVYSLSGQFLGKGKQLLNSLPKGIYVVNNKKYMVK